MGAEVLRDEADWWYLGLDGMAAVRRLRVWRAGPDHLIAVVTQRPGDRGTSVTRAVDVVAAQLAIEHPGEWIELFQHYPADGFASEQFDAALVDDLGRRRWRCVPAGELSARLDRIALNTTVS